MQLRVLTYNIHKGFTTFNREFVLEELRTALRSTHADLALLQEVVGHHADHKKTIHKWPTRPQFEFLADTVWPHYAYARNAVYPQACVDDRTGIRCWPHPAGSYRVKNRGTNISRRLRQLCVALN